MTIEAIVTDVSRRLMKQTILLVAAWIVRWLVIGVILAIIGMFLIVCELAATLH